MKLFHATIALWIATTSFVGGACDAAERVSYTVSIQHVDHAPDERIGQFRIDVHCGEIESISRLPRDWYINIDNMTNCETSIYGNTIHGAGALSGDELRAFNIRVITMDEAYGAFSVSGQVSVTKDFESERRIDLKPSDFRLEESR